MFELWILKRLSCIFVLFEAAMLADPCRYQSGVVYTNIGNATFPVFCDGATDGGGWIVMLNREDASSNFASATWNDFAH